VNTSAVGSRPRTRLLLWGLLVLIVVLYAIPFVHLILTSLKPPSDAIAVPPNIIPKRLTLENFRAALDAQGVVRAFGNSVKTASLSAVLSLALAVPAAYGATRFVTVGGRIFLFVALITRMVPPVATGVPMVGLMRDLHLNDNTIGLAIAHTTISLPLSIWLMASFFEAVPVELEDAAMIDGCSRFGTMARIVVPIVAGGIAVATIFAFLASWNEFLFALLLTATNAQTTPIVIANFQSQFGLDWGPMTALAVLYSLPVVLLAIVLQRRIVAGLTLGALKG
jgi:multiple sugar transport system permease protein